LEYLNIIELYSTDGVSKGRNYARPSRVCIFATGEFFLQFRRKSNRTRAWVITNARL